MFNELIMINTVSAIGNSHMPQQQNNMEKIVHNHYNANHYVRPGMRMCNIYDKIREGQTGLKNVQCHSLRQSFSDFKPVQPQILIHASSLK